MFEIGFWADVSCSSELNPKAVLHDKDKEKEDAWDKCGDTQAHKVIIQVVFNARDAWLGRPAFIDWLWPWEEGRFTDAGTSVTIFKERNPFLDRIKIRLVFERVSKGLEVKVG